MKPIILLNKLGLLNGGSVLDVGARDCSNISDFADKGFSVDAIDIKDIPASCNQKSINYTKIRFEDFSSDKNYDVIIARHVLPFLAISIEDSLEKLFKFLHKNGVLYFTIFGMKDGWCNEPNILTSSADLVREIVKRHGAISYESEEFYEGPTYSGNIKNWHVITMVVVKK
jgi:Methyltransferase domain